MSPPSSDKRTPDELRTLYATTPGIRDYIVEGRGDRNLVRWFLREHGLIHPQVYAVNDRVEVGSDLVIAHGGEVGDRGRVIALGREASLWGLSEPNLTCIVDMDRDCLGSPPACSHLLTSDGGSMDVYALDRKPLQQFLDLVVGISGKAEDLIDEVVPILNELFLLRSAIHEVAAVKLIRKFPELVDFRSGEVDLSSLVRRSLDVEGAGALHGQVMQKIEHMRGALPDDPLLAIRGHDIAPVLVHRLGLKNDWAKPEIVELALRGCLDPDDLAQRPLFAEILSRAHLT